jgi:hypothetical protein
VALLCVISACGPATTTTAAADRTASGGYRFLHAPIAVLDGPYPAADGYGGYYDVVFRLNRALPRTRRPTNAATLKLDQADEGGDPLTIAYTRSRHCYARGFLSSRPDLGGLPLHPASGIHVTVTLKIRGVPHALHERVVLQDLPPRTGPSRDRVLPLAQKLGCV